MKVGRHARLHTQRRFAQQTRSPKKINQGKGKGEAQGMIIISFLSAHRNLGKIQRFNDFI